MVSLMENILWRRSARSITQHLISLYSSNSQMSSAGIIVIGDEILRGDVLDTNSHYLAGELHKMGIQLKKISIIGDTVGPVSEEVKYFSESFNYVITTGGIGPTHDDITYEAVAQAFGQKLALNPVLRDICLKFYKTNDINCPGMKLAYIPQSAQLNYNDGIQTPKLTYPNVSINNVYMFPGIPELMKKSFSSVKNVLFKSKIFFHSKCIYVNATEDKIIPVLDILVKEFPDVQFGSYPKLCDERYKVKITMESVNEESTRRAHENIMKLLPEEVIVNFSDIS